MLLLEAEQWRFRPNKGSLDQEKIARDVCARLVTALWNDRTECNKDWFVAWEPGQASLVRRIESTAQEAARALRGLSIIEAAYLVSSLYTTLLPPEVRSSRGAFYTPPVLVERLIDLVAGEGIDWFSAKILDPSCGGGAFLAPLAHRILNDHRIQSLHPEEQLCHLEQRLYGVELDAFAAWMSGIFLQILVLPVSLEAGRPLRIPISRADALDLIKSDLGKFDLVIGNPPYGRVGLTPTQRQAFARSLYGHANLYGVFLDLALRCRSSTGLVAFVTPTSFMGGQYFSKLRGVLIEEAPPLVIDIVEERYGVFEAVLQETCLAVFGQNPDKTTVVHLLRVSDRAIQVIRAGTFTVNRLAGSPWLFPRSPEQAPLVSRSAGLPNRLSDLGYKASTGPLVWNRHREQLLSSARKGSFPLIWAEAVRKNKFSFCYRTRAEAAFVALKKGQEFLVDREGVVLVQRTTSKEQDRRLVACAVPDTFFSKWTGLVVENHVNVLRVVGRNPVDPKVLAAVLNTRVVDQVFRCLSGSVAVSASELHSLPLPSRGTFDRVAAALDPYRDEMIPEEVEEIVESIVDEAYGIETS